ncbi:hypothetical protein ACF1BB_06325 [Streptomyces griseoluteus]|uniref:hypothetical protein n=1 Tax=Streptomyces griseoluteus TaxID=29306 RepID=UPI0037000398
MNEGTCAPARVRSAGLVAAAACLGLITSCGGDGGTARTESSVSHATGHAYTAAYEAGWRAGKRIFEDDGKGAAVREVVWGGCVRRSLTARPRDVVDGDRGAWVLGCEQGAGSGAERHPPTGPVTRRAPDPDLLGRFRSWAAAHGEQRSARHAGRVVLVHLGTRDYDVELACTRTARSPKADVRRLADAFATWWDGDDGDGTAWNLIVTDPAGQRLFTRALG